MIIPEDAGSDNQYFGVHVLWVGCGDMCRRSLDALRVLQTGGASLSFIDVREADQVKQAPLVGRGTRFFNVENREQQNAFHHYLLENPATHIFIANLPPQHILTAFVLGGKCPNAQIIIAKPLDINFQLAKPTIRTTINKMGKNLTI